MRLLNNTRTAMILSRTHTLLRKPDSTAETVAYADKGVVAQIIECEQGWCALTVADRKGWIQQTALWGVLPDEIIE